MMDISGWYSKVEWYFYLHSYFSAFSKSTTINMNSYYNHKFNKVFNNINHMY